MIQLWWWRPVILNWCTLVSRLFNFRVFRRWLRHRMALVGLLMFSVIVVSALFAPLISSLDPNRGDFGKTDLVPGTVHLLGTDGNGRDTWTRMLYGGRVSLFVGVVGTLMAVFVGSWLGIVSGYAGGVVDVVIQRFTELVMTMPQLLLIIIVVAILGPGIVNMTFVLGIFGWPGICRLVRGQALLIRQQAYVESLRAAGASASYIMWRHVLPNVMPHVIVAGSLFLAGAILTEAALSFLGLGVQPPAASWGNMLQAAQTADILEGKPWRWLAPGLAISICVLSVNFIGDGLRDAIDPKAKLV